MRAMGLTAVLRAAILLRALQCPGKGGFQRNPEGTDVRCGGHRSQNLGSAFRLDPT